MISIGTVSSNLVLSCSSRREDILNALIVSCFDQKAPNVLKPTLSALSSGHVYLVT